MHWFNILFSCRFAFYCAHSVCNNCVLSVVLIKIYLSVCLSVCLSVYSTTHSRVVGEPEQTHTQSVSVLEAYSTCMCMCYRDTKLLRLIEVAVVVTSVNVEIRSTTAWAARRTFALRNVAQTSASFVVEWTPKSLSLTLVGATSARCLFVHYNMVYSGSAGVLWVLAFSDVWMCFMFEFL